MNMAEVLPRGNLGEELEMAGNCVSRSVPTFYGLLDAQCDNNFFFRAAKRSVGKIHVAYQNMKAPFCVGNSAFSNTKTHEFITPGCVKLCSVNHSQKRWIPRLCLIALTSRDALLL